MLQPIGTMVIASDSFAFRLGEVVGHKTDRWGTWHEVKIEPTGRIETVGHIGNADMKGIGWKVATEAEVARCHRYAAMAKGSDGLPDLIVDWARTAGEATLSELAEAHHGWDYFTIAAAVEKLVAAGRLTVDDGVYAAARKVQAQ